MLPPSQDAFISLMLQKVVLETMLSQEKFQKMGSPHALVKSILTILTTDRPKTYLFWGTSIKEKQFLYMLYQNIFQNTPELNHFLSTTVLSEKKQYGLKAAKELDLNISSSASTNELTQYLQKIVIPAGSHQGGPSGHV